MRGIAVLNQVIPREDGGCGCGGGGGGDDNYFMSFIDTRWHSSLLDARLFRASDCDTGHFRVRARMNVFPCNAMRAERGRRGVAVPILNLLAGIGWVVNAPLGCFTPAESPVPIVQEAGLP